MGKDKLLFILLIILAILGSSFKVNPIEIEVSVVDYYEGDSIQDATVSVLNSTQGAITDSKGLAMLTIQDNSSPIKLEVTQLGYEPYKIEITPVQSKTKITAYLTPLCQHYSFPKKKKKAKKKLPILPKR